MNVRAIRLALAAAVDGYRGLHAYPADPGDPELPAAIVLAPDPINYRRTAGRSRSLTFVVTVVVPTGEGLADAELELDRIRSDDGADTLVSRIEAPNTAWRQAAVMQSVNVRPITRSTDDLTVVAMAADILVTITTTTESE